MENWINDVSVTGKQFGFALERIGVSGIGIYLTPAALANYQNSFIEDFMSDLFKAFESEKKLGRAARYIYALDLVMLACQQRRSRYELNQDEVLRMVRMAKNQDGEDPRQTRLTGIPDFSMRLVA